MRPLRTVLFAMALLACAGPVMAQRTTCDIVERPGGTLILIGGGTGAETYVIGRAFFNCSGGRRIIADSATYSRASGHITLMGNVQVDDTERTLRSDFAQYFTQIRQISARDRVVLQDIRTGSIIHSDLLNMYEATATRPQSLVVATRITGPQARAILFDEQPGAAGERPDSMIVDADEIQIVGNESFRGTGSAVLTRDSLRATAHQIDYQQQQGSLHILGGGHVTLPRYELRGDSITASLDDDREIREVLTRHRASLTSEDMEVTAPAVRLFFEDGSISRMVAMTWAPMQNAAPGPRPIALTPQFRMEADSLDVLAPEQQIREAAAIGSAHVERFTPDSLRALLPEAEPGIMALIANDWMRGDTVRAFFAAAGDTTQAEGSTERVMERLTATGAAQAMHRMRQDNAAPDARLSIAYLVGRMVDVSFADGIVSDVVASQDVRGVYLQPGNAARQTGDGQTTASARRPPQ
ncbi:hypothetical protein BH23GEM9_BH23GEM9_04180 [soil metagenome]